MENKSSGTLVINGNSGPLKTIAKTNSDSPKVTVITANAVPLNINNADVVNNNSNNVRNETNNRTSTSTATNSTTSTTNTTVVSTTNSTVNVNNVPVVENERESEVRLTVFFSLMKNEKERLLTFVEGKWPISFISKESLANAGFFYLMNSDRVQCAFCEGVVCYWEPDDIPLVEHRHHFPRCPFLMGYDVGNIPIDKDPIRGDKRLGRDVCGGYHRVAVTPTQDSLLKTYSVPPITVNLEDFGVLVHKGAKNSKYASRDYRTASFAGKWPKDCKYKPEELAEAGFFYCGVSDCVKCFYCDVGICDWNKLRTPWIEHAIRSPEWITIHCLEQQKLFRGLVEDFDIN
ncbi:putative inhibitor of apoptosis-like protein [Leptotrombidium deliense]|uniref:Putative inhibitor of apoptosis-like protein n=1 Tax=Leptotrombidium deliense TaxID=299467 RepID=A0A443SUU8_9ACAR|nr:putative inhibitor of apoptosis-like protein [Leptotrombidium deliense]